METSPHTRGEPPQGNLAAYGVGNIPAYAGRTFCSYSISRIFWKHPRIRGENPVVNSAVGAARETSPHTRGERRNQKVCRVRRRNIPAYAGRTDKLLERSDLVRKHPRIRGENVAILAAHKKAKETSPHTRGEQAILPLLASSLRNIPAYAGRTNRMWSRQGRFEKHPRIRGENLTSISCWSVQTETSPHTRGEQV